MTLEKYKEKLNEYRQEARKKELALAKEFCFSNNDIKVGDIFTDHIGSIKVEKIEFGFYSLDGIPSCKYIGLTLKKDGTPTKRTERRSGFQSNKES